RAIAAIEKEGGKVIIDATDPDHPFTKVVLGGFSTDAVLVHLKALPNLQEVRPADFSVPQITDAGMENFKSLTKLRKLQLIGRISDAGIANLKGLTELQSLSFQPTSVTDAGLAHLQGLTKLQTLVLPGGIGNKGLEHLKGLTELRDLYLSRPIPEEIGL